MKPLIIFQLRDSMKVERVRELVDIIEKGIDNGRLIIDNSVNILYFDKDGNLEYVTPSKDNVAIK